MVKVVFEFSACSTKEALDVRYVFTHYIYDIFGVRPLQLWGYFSRFGGRLCHSQIFGFEDAAKNLSSNISILEKILVKSYELDCRGGHSSRFRKSLNPSLRLRTPLNTVSLIYCS